MKAIPVGADAQQFEDIGWITHSLTIRDFGGKEWITAAVAEMAIGEELHLGDVIGRVDAVETVRSRYSDGNGNSRDNVLLRGLFETTLPGSGKKCLSSVMWLPGDFPRRIKERFDASPAQELEIAASVYAVRLAEEGRQCPYCYKVRVGTLAQQRPRELRRLRRSPQSADRRQGNSKQKADW